MNRLLRHQTHPTLSFERSLWDAGRTRIAGVDEVGRGPLAGPVVAAAVVFSRGATIPEVNDSKKLSELQRERLFPEILKAASGIGIGIVDHTTIDTINIYQASILAMKSALEELPFEPDAVLADGNSFLHKRFDVRNVVGGDARCCSIAAASIVAKVTRDRLMKSVDGRFPQYGFAQNKGYATSRHIRAIEVFGPCEIHRRSFKVRSLAKSELVAPDEIETQLAVSD